MKKIYLYAVALSLAFTSCSSDAWEQDDLTQTAVKKTEQAYETGRVYKTTQSSLINLINTIENDCVNITDKAIEGRIATVEHIAFQYKTFQELVAEGYNTPSVLDWHYLTTTEKGTIINSLNYSAAVKSYLYAMLIDKQVFTDSFYENTTLSVYEQELLETCKELNDTGGDDDDTGDDDDDNDPIRYRSAAFAYGYQTSKANAVIMAVLF